MRQRQERQLHQQLQRQLQRVTIAPQQIQSNNRGSSQVTIGQCFEFTQEQQHYLLRVLRLKSGDRFLAIFPDRTTWLAEISPKDSELPTLQTLTFELLELQVVMSELPVEITLVVSLPKGSGFDDVVRQVTELGVSRVIPVMSDRTVLKPSGHRHDRWQRIAAEATEQSERSLTPKIEVPTHFSQYLQSISQAVQPSTNPKSDASNYSYLCWGRGDSNHLLAQVQQDVTSQNRNGINITIAIGPEGGWTDGEVQSAIDAGFITVSLGKRILRAITAPAAAMAIVAAAIES